MKGPARTLLIAFVLVAVGLGVFSAYAVTRFDGGCEYHPIRERVSPSGRYVARWITVDCGMNAWSNEVLVQDRWFPGLPGIDGRPAGARVTRELDTIVGGSDIEWGEGDVLTLVHGSRVAPEVERRSVGAVRVETRASP